MDKNKKMTLQCLKTCRGQIDGIIKMIEDERYCIDISNQIISAQGLLKKSNSMILKNHLNHCVKEAMHQDNADEKIDEVIDILGKLLGK